MQCRTFMVVVVVALAAPAGLEAQRIGFRVGVAAPPRAPLTPFGGTAVPYYGYAHNPYADPFGVTHNNPYNHPHGVHNNNPYNGLPRSGYVVPAHPHAPAGTLLHSRIFVTGQKVSPGHQPPASSPIVVVPGIGIGNRRRHGRPANYPTVFIPGSPVIPPAGGGVFVTGSNRAHQPPPPVSPGVGVGSTRADLIALYGQPTVSMANRYGEALVFGGTTFLIQNGVVTQVNGR